MNAIWAPLTVNLVLAWVRVYTMGMPARARDQRRAEIASDLWEHQAEAYQTGLTCGALASEIAGRWVRGIPADVTWRLNVEGDRTMLSRTVVERAAGLLFLLVVGLIVLGTATGRVGIGADEPYFTYDFPNFARNLEPLVRGLTIMGVASVALIAAAAGFWVAFQRHEPMMAAAGGFAFAASGVVLLIAVGAGRAVYSLAEQWRTSGTYYDAMWQAARGSALLFEFLAFAAFGLLLVGLLAVGLLGLQCGVLPRGLSALAAMSGTCLPLAIGLEWLNAGSPYTVLMTGVVLGLTWFVATGSWLVLRGLPGALAAQPSTAHP